MWCKGTENTSNFSQNEYLCRSNLFAFIKKEHCLRELYGFEIRICPEYITSATNI